ncbi:Lrp/AsnC family transcriptional regulator [Candidatus Woesearchaeota archaeon]|nr:Lrp/AsnC family transcriptional regulator [Candidatus Woesearchaeota archaeon]
MKELFSIEFGEKIKLDNKDKKIIELIQKNARISISQMSRKTGIPRDSIKYRLRRLEKEKVIRFYHAFLNPSKLGYPMYTYVTFVLSNVTQEKEKEFISFLVSHPNIIYVSKNSGKWDFTIGICSKEFKEFDDIIRTVRLKFSDIIKEFESSSVIQEYKYDYMADLI